MIYDLRHYARHESLVDSLKKPFPYRARYGVAGHSIESRFTEIGKLAIEALQSECFKRR